MSKTVRPLCIESSILVSPGKKKATRICPHDFEDVVDSGSFSSSEVKLRDYSENHFMGFFGHGAIPKVNFEYVTHTPKYFKEN